MAFNFSWTNFSDKFVENARQLLTDALNKGSKPAIICDTITVKSLCMGASPPALELVELGELGDESFRGTFRLKYAGDAHLVIQTKVQANPLLGRPTHRLPFSPVQMVAADAPLTVPMFLRLAEMELDGSVILLFTGTGLNMVFRNDPLQKVKVTSTFDSIPAIRDFLQSQIERKLRQLVCDELPSIVQQLSAHWLRARAGKTGGDGSASSKGSDIGSPVSSGTKDSGYYSTAADSSGYSTPYHHHHYAHPAVAMPALYRNRSFTASSLTGGGGGGMGSFDHLPSLYRNHSYTASASVSVSAGASAGVSGPGSAANLPSLCRNQSFTGRGALEPFTPAIAQAIAESAWERDSNVSRESGGSAGTRSVAGTSYAASLASSAPGGGYRQGARRRRKKHSIISLRPTGTTPATSAANVTAIGLKQQPGDGDAAAGMTPLPPVDEKTSA